MQSDVDALRSTDLFAELPEQHLSRLALLVQHRAYERGDLIFDEGDPGNALFVVETGEVRIAKAIGDDQSLTLAVLGPGQAFGELALLDGKRRSASATALEPTKCLVVYRDDFMALVEEEPTALRAVLRSLSGMIRSTNQKLSDVIGLDSNALMAKALSDLIEKHGKVVDDGVLINRPITPEDLSSTTGLHSRVVATLMRDYQFQDLLRVVGEFVTVRRPEAFERWLEERPT
ncbi:MAG: Crp/Fnr family transcriptional regulator [Anaerolineae bacterium]